MKDLKVKIKRQTEILGLVLANPDKYQIYDFEELYEVNDLTIKRDLQELRSLGIDIHSEGKKGITVYSKIPNVSILSKKGGTVRKRPEVYEITADSFRVIINSSDQSGEWRWRARGILLESIKKN